MTFLEIINKISNHGEVTLRFTNTLKEKEIISFSKKSSIEEIEDFVSNYSDYEIENNIFIPTHYFNPNYEEWERINNERKNWYEDRIQNNLMKSIIPFNEYIMIIWYKTDNDGYNLISLYKGTLKKN